MFSILVKTFWINGNEKGEVKVFDKANAIELGKEIYDCVDVISVLVIDAFTGEIVWGKEYGEIIVG